MPVLLDNTVFVLPVKFHDRSEQRPLQCITDTYGRSNDPEGDLINPGRNCIREQGCLQGWSNQKKIGEGGGPTYKAII